MKKIIEQVLKKKKILIVSEIGINHFGSLKYAKKIVDAIKDGGGEAVKVQIHLPDEEMSSEARNIKPGNSNKNIFSIIKQNSLSLEQEDKLKKYIEKKNLLYIATPFSYKAATWLHKKKIKIFKIGSGECNNLPLIEHVSSFGKPMIISTGMNNLNDVKKTLSFLKKKNKNILLHCVNLYPTEIKDINFQRMSKMIKKFKKSIIGFSDHTVGTNAAKIAISKGAWVIEKHFALNKKDKGPDISCSMDKSDLIDLIKFSKDFLITEFKKKNFKDIEKVTKRFAFHSVVTKKKIKKGEFFSYDNLTTKRPGTGDFHANKIIKLIGKRAKIDIDNNILLKKKHVQA